VKHYDQELIEATTAAGCTEIFAFGYYTTREDAETEARTFAGPRGTVNLVGRNRLNMYVGSPVWSDTEVIEYL
jgi:hypothetical protein